MKSKTVYCQQCGKGGSNAELDGQGNYICKQCKYSRADLAEMQAEEISLHDCYYYQDSDF